MSFFVATTLSRTRRCGGIPAVEVKSHGGPADTAWGGCHMSESAIGLDKGTERIEAAFSAPALPSVDALQPAFSDFAAVEVTKSVHQILLRQFEASRRMLETMQQAFLRDMEA